MTVILSQSQWIRGDIESLATKEEDDLSNCSISTVPPDGLAQLSTQFDWIGYKFRS